MGDDKEILIVEDSPTQALQLLVLEEKAPGLVIRRKTGQISF